MTAPRTWAGVIADRARTLELSAETWGQWDLGSVGGMGQLVGPCGVRAPVGLHHPHGQADGCPLHPAPHLQLALHGNRALGFGTEGRVPHRTSRFRPRLASDCRPAPGLPVNSRVRSADRIRFVRYRAPQGGRTLEFARRPPGRRPGQTCCGTAMPRNRTAVPAAFPSHAFPIIIGRGTRAKLVGFRQSECWEQMTRGYDAGCA